MMLALGAHAQNKADRKKLNKRSYNVTSRGDKWENKKIDRSHGKKGKKLTYYVGGWGLAAPCPVYGGNPVRRDVMKRYHYSRSSKKH